jgi:hypothetical protein
VWGCVRVPDADLQYESHVSISQNQHIVSQEHKHITKHKMERARTGQQHAMNDLSASQGARSINVSVPASPCLLSKPVCCKLWGATMSSCPSP